VIELSLAEVAALTGGEVHDAGAGARVDSVAVDSREVTPGALFVALAGERSDGHDHAPAAVAAGATGVLAARPLGLPAVVVPDPLRALGRLARGVLDRLPGLTVVGLTGSSGKTSTKDLLAQVLEPAGPTVAPRNSFNNDVGVPLTALAVDRGTRYLVVEMGARGPGHIGRLCELAPPRVGVVLNVGAAHAGEFGSRAATAAAKRELVEALPGAAAGGVAVLNADDELVRAMAAGTGARVVWFGLTEGVDVRAADVRLDPAARAAFELVTPEGTAPVRLQVHGAHQVSNALAAAAVGRELGLPVEQVATALSGALPRSRWRMQVSDRPDGVTVVNDAYNANPDSVRAALSALAAMGTARRTWAVLGEMLELGAASGAEHEEVGRLAGQLRISRLVVVGAGARDILRGAGPAAVERGEAVFVPDADAATTLLRDEVRPGDVVLVKASRGAALERVAEELAAPAPAAGERRG
jgi:UDP-N-acetylmuramoyl-tripeptide--D-alanyl-D-alanine ligase